MIVTIPQKVLDVCIAVEQASGYETLGIGFDREMWSWVFTSHDGQIFAKLNPDRFGVPPEVEDEP